MWKKNDYKKTSRDNKGDRRQATGNRRLAKGQSNRRTVIPSNRQTKKKTE